MTETYTLLINDFDEIDISYWNTSGAAIQEGDKSLEKRQSRWYKVIILETGRILAEKSLHEEPTHE